MEDKIAELEIRISALEKANTELLALNAMCIESITKITEVSNDIIHTQREQDQAHTNILNQMLNRLKRLHGELN